MVVNITCATSHSCCNAVTALSTLYTPLTFANLAIVVAQLFTVSLLWIFLFRIFRRGRSEKHFIVLTSSADGYNSPGPSEDSHFADASLNRGHDDGMREQSSFVASPQALLSGLHMTLLSVYLVICCISFAALFLPASPFSRVVQMLAHQSTWYLPVFLLALLFWRNWKRSRAVVVSVVVALLAFAFPTMLSFIMSAPLAPVANCTNCPLVFFGHFSLISPLMLLALWIVGLILALRNKRFRMLSSYMIGWSLVRLIPAGLLLSNSLFDDGVCGMVVVEIIFSVSAPVVIAAALVGDARSISSFNDDGESRPLVTNTVPPPASPAAAAAAAPSVQARFDSTPSQKKASPVVKQKKVSSAPTEQEKIAAFLLENLDESVRVVDFQQIARERKIGAGGFGEVFVGKMGDQVVAIKRVLDLDQKKVRTFLREINTMAHLSHPHILKLIGVAVTPHDSYLLTEFVERGSLFDIIHDKKRRRDRRAITWANSIKILRETADGMSYLHGLDPPFIHRDLKSQNILIADHWMVKICDFGMARVRSLGVTMTKLGTLQWVAPEVLRDERYSEKADVYSFAILVWELVARRVPYMGQNSLAVARAVAFNGLRPEVNLETYPPPLLDLMQMCWNKDAAARPSFVEIIDFIDNIHDVSGWHDPVE